MGVAPTSSTDHLSVERKRRLYLSIERRVKMRGESLRRTKSSNALGFALKDEGVANAVDSFKSEGFKMKFVIHKCIAPKSNAANQQVRKSIGPCRLSTRSQGNVLPSQEPVLLVRAKLAGG